MKRPIPFLSKSPRVSVIRLSGVISAGGRPGSGLNDAALAQVIERAFSRGKPAAVAIALNSPGGSPAQSSLIGARIRRLADEKSIPVHAFVEDVAASGGYWIAAAADEIWVDRNSIVGSIGVISSGFGLHDLIDRYGIERRVHTAGASKTLLDPFQPEKTEDVARLNTLLEQIHGTFIDHVKDRRGAKIDGAGDLFTGDIWVGQRSVDVGLADGVGHLVPKMKELYGDKVKFQRYGQKKGLLQRFGASIVADGAAAIEERAQFARFGL